MEGRDLEGVAAPAPAAAPAAADDDSSCSSFSDSSTVSDSSAFSDSSSSRIFPFAFVSDTASPSSPSSSSSSPLTRALYAAHSSCTRVSDGLFLFSKLADRTSKQNRHCATVAIFGVQGDYFVGRCQFGEMCGETRQSGISASHHMSLDLIVKAKEKGDMRR